MEDNLENNKENSQDQNLDKNLNDNLANNLDNNSEENFIQSVSPLSVDNNLIEENLIEKKFSVYINVYTNDKPDEITDWLTKQY